MTARPGSRRPRGLARREALLEAALTIVADVGADAVTHRRVAEVAQLPLASTTYWFESKEQLLTAALELAAERDVAHLHEHAARLAAGAGDDAGGGLDPTAALDAVVAVVCDPVDEPSSRTALMAAYGLMLEAARRPALQDLSQRWTDAYLETIGALMKRAGSRCPRDDARLILAAADGLRIDQLAVGAAGDPAPALRRLARALLESSS